MVRSSPLSERIGRTCITPGKSDHVCNTVESFGRYNTGCRFELLRYEWIIVVCKYGPRGGDNTELLSRGKMPMSPGTTALELLSQKALKDYENVTGIRTLHRKQYLHDAVVSSTRI